MKPFFSFTRSSGVVLLALLGCAPVATAQVAVMSPILVERDAAPGESYTGAISLKNQSGELRRIRVYQTDYTFEAGGSNTFDAPGTVPRSNARWVNLSTTETVVPANGEAAIDYTVTVPRLATLSGTYWSMIMVEQEPDQISTSDKPGLALTPTIRYGIQLATNLQSSAPARVAFTAPVVDGRTMSFDVSNPGDRSVRPNVRVEIYREDGTLVMAADAQRGLLYPGTSVRQTIGLQADLAPGMYTAIILADIGDYQLTARRFTIWH
jgi:hypothetical protein